MTNRQRQAINNMRAFLGEGKFRGSLSVGEASALIKELILRVNDREEAYSRVPAFVLYGGGASFWD